MVYWCTVHGILVLMHCQQNTPTRCLKHLALHVLLMECACAADSLFHCPLPLSYDFRTNRASMFKILLQGCVRMTQMVATMCAGNQHIVKKLSLWTKGNHDELTSPGISHLCVISCEVSSNSVFYHNALFSFTSNLMLCVHTINPDSSPLFW